MTKMELFKSKLEVLNDVESKKINGGTQNDSSTATNAGIKTKPADTY